MKAEPTDHTFSGNRRMSDVIVVRHQWDDGQWQDIKAFFNSIATPFHKIASLLVQMAMLLKRSLECVAGGVKLFKGGSGESPPTDPLDSREDAKNYLRMVVKTVAHGVKGVRSKAGAVDYLLQAKPGMKHYEYAVRILDIQKRFGWGADTMKQYAKDIGKEKNSSRGYGRRVKRRRKRRRVREDLDSMA